MPKPPLRLPPGLLASKLFWGRNSMCRPTDRIEWRVAAFLVLLALLVVPAAAALGTATQDSLSRSAARQASVSYRTIAVLGRDAPHVEPVGAAGPMATKPLTRATWRTADNTVRNGLVRTEYGAEQGSRVPVWLDPSGHPTSAPRSGAEITVIAVFTAVLVLIVLEVGLALLYGAVRWVLERKRLTGWDEEWARIEPNWREEHR